MPSFKTFCKIAFDIDEVSRFFIAFHILNLV